MAFKNVTLTVQISNERKTATLAVVGLRTDGEKNSYTSITIDKSLVHKQATDLNPRYSERTG
jgi:hypothetical protein